MPCLCLSASTIRTRIALCASPEPSPPSPLQSLDKLYFADEFQVPPRGGAASVPPAWMAPPCHTGPPRAATRPLQRPCSACVCDATAPQEVPPKTFAEIRNAAQLDGWLDFFGGLQGIAAEAEEPEGGSEAFNATSYYAAEQLPEACRRPQAPLPPRACRRGGGAWCGALSLAACGNGCAPNGFAAHSRDQTRARGSRA